MSRDDLAHNPILHRELEIRASGDEGYRLFNYSGPGHYLLLLQLPLIYGLLSLTMGLSSAPHGASARSAISEAWTTPLFLVTLWLQTLYFTHSAARFCAGSVVVERERGTFDALRLLPRSARDIFVGKYVAAIAPLICEALIAIPFLALYAWFGAVSVGVVLLAAAFEVGLILVFGMWGMFWSLHSRDVLSAVSRAFCTALAINVMPLVLGMVVLVSHDVTPMWWKMSPLGLSYELVHVGQMGFSSMVADVPLFALIGAASAALMVLLYRMSLRRLSTR